MADAVHGNMALFHRLQQGALRPWAGAVNLVSEYDSGQNRAGAIFKIVRLAVIDADAHYVGRKQVRCELDALKANAQRGGQRLRQHRLADPGYVFQQHVTFTEEGHQQLINNLILANDYLRNVLPQPLGKVLYVGDV